jgi:hypothetical protein
VPDLYVLKPRGIEFDKNWKKLEILLKRRLVHKVIKEVTRIPHMGKLLGNEYTCKCALILDVCVDSWFSRIFHPLEKLKQLSLARFLIRAR